MRVATAYMLLRPFLPDVPDDSMCGATEGSPLPVTEEWHAPLLNALVRLPPLSPGDAVFWHPDLIVAESTVVQPPDRQYAGMFVSSLPLCPQNSSFGVRPCEFLISPLCTSNELRIHTRLDRGMLS
jgi:hypothetical protein